MVKLSALVILPLLSCGLLQAAPPSDLELAQASQIAYRIQFGSLEQHRASLQALPNYELYDFEEDEHQVEIAGFRGLALINRQTRTLIIAYRGTEPTNGRNIIVDGGLFLTVAGDNAVPVVLKEMSKFSTHYGTVAAVGTTVAAVLASQFNMAPEGKEAVQELMLDQAFGRLGITYDPDYPVEAHTWAIVKHATAFFTKTMRNLHKDFNQEYQPSALQGAAHWMGLKADPRTAPPAGYEVYVTGHSLGGFLAQLVAAKEGVPAVTFNAPGAEEYATKRKLALKSLALIRNIYRANDIVGSFATHLGLSEEAKNFYDDRPEAGRLEAAFDQEEKKCQVKRRQQLERERQAFPARMERFAAEQANYLRAMATYQEELAAFEAKHEHRYTVNRWLVSLASAPAKPIAPTEPAEPTLEAIHIRNRFGYSNQARARELYGMAGYVLNNHSLERIIEGLEDAQAQGRSVTNCGIVGGV